MSKQLNSSSSDTLKGARPSLWSSEDELTLLARFTPTEFINVVNQTLDYAYHEATIVGEVASFKINQGKWVFFDIKDEESSISCFMTLYQLRIPIEDGMKVMVKGVPKVTKWGKFSFTVQAVKPVGEGSLKKAYEILKKKLSSEGLFDATKKRTLPKDLTKIGVISSTAAAGYADFVKIINARWGGLRVQVAHTQVQGLDAPDQIIRALNYFNEKSEMQVIAILRGGGSADDLSCFNDEKLVRIIAASKIPVITGIGHEVDESLADLAADVRASTPSNAAEILTRDKKEERIKLEKNINRVTQVVLQEVGRAKMVNAEKVEKISSGIISKYIEPMVEQCRKKIQECVDKIKVEFREMEKNLQHKIKLLETLNPERILAQGYAILSGKISPGNVVKITTIKQEIEAEIKKIKER
ncbi:exodeoxyribonuclease VII large subunit [Candidatus Saccharibacteria bacterium]|nr:exodeoxyribonuclease VII large subunit [Candidatus Saccharibacteria bacterium]